MLDTFIIYVGHPSCIRNLHLLLFRVFTEINDRCITNYKFNVNLLKVEYNKINFIKLNIILLNYN